MCRIDPRQYLTSLGIQGFAAGGRIPDSGDADDRGTGVDGMSYATGRAALRLELAERMAHTEYCSNFALVRAVTGLDPQKDPAAWRAFYDAWDIDFIWSTDDGPVGWDQRGRVTDMGHAEFLEGGIDRREPSRSPFNDAEEVLQFDAVAEYGLPDIQELTDYYERAWTQGQASYPGQVFTGGYYQTIMSGAIAAFGWEMLLQAAADRPRFAKVLDSFYRLTRRSVEAWAGTSADVFIQHDDFVWSAGLFLHPSIYREVIIPRYAELWKILHDAGKMVLFCSDGDFTCFIHDIIEAGADGLIFEPMTDVDLIAERYGKTHVIIGSKVDCRTLTFGSRDQIRNEVDATVAVARRCPGFVCAVGNHIPSNVPLDNALYYMDYLGSRWKR